MWYNGYMPTTDTAGTARRKMEAAEYIARHEDVGLAAAHGYVSEPGLLGAYCSSKGF
jgi:hypothetical protein